MTKRWQALFVFAGLFATLTFAPAAPTAFAAPAASATTTAPATTAQKPAAAKPKAAASKPGAKPGTTKATVPAVQLAETRPVETTLGNKAQIADALGVWLDMIKGAKKSLDFEEFYLSSWPGEPMEQVLDAIGQAAKRGVKVRILLDRGMYATYPMPAESLRTVENIEVRAVDMRKRAGGVQHSKFFLVDGRETYVGSQNMDWRSFKHIHEMGVRVRDPRLADAFGGVFDMDWAAADTLAPAAERNAAIEAGKARARTAAGTDPWWSLVQAPDDTVRIAPAWSPPEFSPDRMHWDLDRIVALINRAKQDISVQLLIYAVEARGLRDTTVDDALRQAAARGVKVRLLVSDWQAGGKGMAATQSLAQVPNIEVRMMTIPELKDGTYIPFARVQHCKFMVVDGEAMWIGTSNWDPSYWSSSRNVSVSLWNRGLAQEVLATFNRSWTDPGAAKIDPNQTYEAKVRGEEPPPGRKAYGR
jgi:phosphatidylserine/phosphatidylglycerophosphate/cardiolipin synthase-like enzyme